MANLGLKLSFLCVFMASFYSLTAQNYMVLRIKYGNIHDVTQKADLFPSQSITADDLLTFSNQQATATLMDNQKNLYQLITSGKLTATKVKELLSQMAKAPKSGVRDAGTKAVSDLGAYFGKRTFYILGDVLKIRLAGSYLEDPSDFFVLKREQDGKPQIAKIPRTSGDTLVISKTVFSPFLSPEEPTTIHWVDAQTKKASPEAKISIEFVSETELKGVFKGLQQILVKNKTEKPTYQQLLEEYYYYFEQLYGYTDLAILEKWLKTNNYLN
jgi:hypothetical protein